MFPKGEIKVVLHWLFLCSKGGLFNFKNSRIPFFFHDYPYLLLTRKKPSQVPLSSAHLLASAHRPSFGQWERRCNSADSGWELEQRIDYVATRN